VRLKYEEVATFEGMVEVGIVLTDGLKDTALPTTRMCAQWMDNLCQLAHVS
jgi:hypothetical protein